MNLLLIMCYVGDKPTISLLHVQGLTSKPPKVQFVEGKGRIPYKESVVMLHQLALMLKIYDFTSTNTVLYYISTLLYFV